MTPSTKCPKCGSGFRAAYRDAVEYECGSVYYKMLNAAPHGSKTCFRISALHTSLEKAKDALKKNTEIQNPENLTGRHLTDARRAQLAFAVINHVKASASAVLKEISEI